MKVHQIFFKNVLRNFSYVIVFDDGAIYCIDPFDSKEIFNCLGNRSLSGIINTHDHCDHHSGNEKLVSAFHCSVIAHPKAVVPHKNKNTLNQEIIYQTVSDQTEWTLKTIFTPGHTASHIAVMLEKNGKAYAFFTGDCFFNAGVGNCHNGGDPAELYQTINSIFDPLPDDVLIYPGHDYLKRNLEFTHRYEPHNTAAQKFLHKISPLNLDEQFFVNTMKIERDINTFLRLDSNDLLKTLGLKNSNKKQVFLTLRELRNNW